MKLTMWRVVVVLNAHEVTGGKGSFNFPNRQEKMKEIFFPKRRVYAY